VDDDEEQVLAARIERIAMWNPHLRQAERADLLHAAHVVAERTTPSPPVPAGGVPLR